MPPVTGLRDPGAGPWIPWSPSCTDAWKQVSPVAGPDLRLHQEQNPGSPVAAPSPSAPRSHAGAQTHAHTREKPSKAVPTPGCPWSPGLNLL